MKGRIALMLLLGWIYTVTVRGPALDGPILATITYGPFVSQEICQADRDHSLRTFLTASPAQVGWSICYLSGPSSWWQPQPASAQEAARTYWIVAPAAYARAGSAHTHVQVTGWVSATRMEPDGDRHIQITADAGVTRPFFIAECIPQLPCASPAVGRQITLQGISRYDREHRWWEIHPVEAIL